MRTYIHIDTDDILAKIDTRLYSSFIEHMGRAVYTGIYEPTHPTANQDGFREDVMKLIRPLKLSCIRYPGGNFVSGYDWRDGVGDKARRPVRRDLAWFAIEPNQVGLNEFVTWTRGIGAEPMLAVNLGTGTPQDAAELLEYCNVEGGTALSDLRRSHGFAEPHHIKLWCLGNEMDGPWQICGKTAEEYGRLAHETAKLMKWADPSIELVACGSSFRDMPTFGAWERTVLRHCWNDVEYLSLHQYYQNNDGDVRSFLARSEEMDAFIREVAGICREIKAELGSDKEMKLSFDEWNVWYHFQKDHEMPEKWIYPRPIEEETYDFADALLVGSMLTTLINNADTVKIACMAQLVNAIAPIMTEPGGAVWTQTIYWPFLYTSRYGRGFALRLKTEAPSYACKINSSASTLASAGVLSEDGNYVTLFLINKSLDDGMSLDISGINGTVEKWISISGFGLDAANTLDQQKVIPQSVAPASLSEPVPPPASWNMLRISLQTN